VRIVVYISGLPRQDGPNPVEARALLGGVALAEQAREPDLQVGSAEFRSDFLRPVRSL
jgi:hypothetical protein